MELNQWSDMKRGQTCVVCSEINFKTLFAGNLAMYELGTLQDIAQRSTCPTCNLFIQGVRDAWSYSSTDLARIERPVRCWIRSVFWAQHTIPEGSWKSGRLIDEPVNSDEPYWAAYTLPKDVFREEKHHLHHRISLGADWQPGHQKRSYNEDLVRYKVVDLDIFDNVSRIPFSTGDLSWLFWRRPLPSQCNMELIRGWISECERHHVHQLSDERHDIEKLQSIRFRVIDVVEERLVEAPLDCRYIALSYVWGDRMDNYPLDLAVNRKDGILNVAKVPQTIKDAMYFTNSLGERYLWVDWICIDQSNATDLIRHMDVVYESSYCTLVAAAGEDSDAGLPGLHPKSRQTEEITEVTSQHGTVHLALSRPTIKEILQRSRWSDRGWTYQELLLSKRCIVFTKDEVFYTCPDNLHASRIPLANYSFTSFDERRICNWREAYNLETHKVYTMHQFYFRWDSGWGRMADDLVGRLLPSWKIYENHVHPLAAYIRSVEEYTARKLTNSGDIVAAFSGILNRLWKADEIGTALETGVPLACLPLGGLLWNSLYPKGLVRRSVVHGQTENSRFPSWSWSGWEGPVEYPIRLEKDALDEDEWIYESKFDRRPKIGYLILSRDALLSFFMDENGAIIGTISSQNIVPSPIAKPASDTISLWTDCLSISHSYDTVDSVSETIVEDLSGYIQLDESPSTSPDSSGPRKWLLAAVALGRRRHRYESQANSLLSLPEEVIALLIYSQGAEYKRAGIACVPMSAWSSWQALRTLDRRWITLK